jgi:hypothetical protein
MLITQFHLKNAKEYIGLRPDIHATKARTEESLDDV